MDMFAVALIGVFVAGLLLFILAMSISRWHDWQDKKRHAHQTSSHR